MKGKSRKKATKKFKSTLKDIALIVGAIFLLTKIIEILLKFTFEISIILAAFTIYVIWIEYRIREMENKNGR